MDSINTKLTGEDINQDVVPSAFAPLVSVGSVVEATRGRQVFNDSDKDNYFEG